MLYGVGMAYHLHPRNDLSINELEQRYRAAKEPPERTWWQILWLLARGQTARTVAQSTGYSPYWIGQIAKRYNEQGAAGMTNRQHTTSRRTPPLLSAALQEELRQALAGKPPGGARYWRARTVADWMAERLGRPVSVCSAAGPTASASSTARKCRVRAMPAPIRRSRRPLKKEPPARPSRRHRLPAGHGRAVGDG